MKIEESNIVETNDYRVIIYPASRPFTAKESKVIAEKLYDFLGDWAAHGKELSSSFKIEKNQFIIICVDEEKAVASGCSIDALGKIMKNKIFSTYIDALLDADLPNLQTIRIGTKALAYWPYKFLTDDDAQQTLHTFRKIAHKGINLAIMAHFNHPVEMSTDAAKEAIKEIRKTGAQIRTQSPLMKHINDSAEIWAEMWREQVNQNCIPYYMFLARDTGAQHYFKVSLVDAWEIFRNAYQQISGVCRTVRGPSMSADPGKVQILGVSEVNDQKVLSLRFLQGRDPDWIGKPFFAEYDEETYWLDELKPAFGEEKFFFEN